MLHAFFSLRCLRAVWCGAALLLMSGASAASVGALSGDTLPAAIRSGEAWVDTRGERINAHGGGMLFHEGWYYWLGEHKSDHTNAALVGITCYRSRDLLHWDYRGVALPVTDSIGHLLERGCTMERPKVVFNARTRQFVLWFHLELKGHGYEAALAAVAVSPKPEGPYRLLRAERVNAGRLPMDIDRTALEALRPDDFREWWTPEWRQAIEAGLFVKRDVAGGQMARDMTLFVDDDGTAYHLYSSEDNLTLHIAELTPDYCRHTGRYVRLAPGGHNEAPALFKHGGRYWLIASGCTGWTPNAARLFSAPHPFGPWTAHGNPCVGEGAGRTFESQGTCIFPLQGCPDAFVFMADRWRPDHPSDGRYVWLPLRFLPDGRPFLEWVEAWQPQALCP